MFEPLEIPGLLLIRPRRHQDSRGYFTETFSEDVFAGHNLPRFVQDNESMSQRAGTIRGLHYQTEPFAQAKLVRCTAGSILDVAVDLRTGSPTFGRHDAVKLSAADGALLYIPIGFAHGFCTLAADTIVAYKVSKPYSPAHEVGLAWDDPQLGIRWPVDSAAAILSDRDRRHPGLASLPAAFAWAN